MKKIYRIEGFCGPGGIEPILKEVTSTPQPKEFLGDTIRQINKRCEVDFIEPGQSNLEKKLREYIMSPLSQIKDRENKRVQDKISLEMIDRMHNIPMRFALLRYNGADIVVGGSRSFNLKSGGLMGVNISKQTFVYPLEWFKGLLASEGKVSMDELTTAVTSKHSPHPLKSYGEIAKLREGPLKPGVGAGFLLMAFIDERLRGAGLSQPLLSSALGYYYDSVGVPYVFAYGRVPGISGDPEASKSFEENKVVKPTILNRYLKEVLDRKRKDPGVGIHRMGHIICGIPALDKKSLNCGFLAVYDLNELRMSKRI